MKRPFARVLASDFVLLAVVAAVVFSPTIALAQTTDPEINALAAALGSHQWILLSALAIHLAIRLMKSDTIGPTVPPRWRPVVAFGLGQVSGVFDMVVAHTRWGQAILWGLVTSVTAILGDTMIRQAVFGGRELPLPKAMHKSMGEMGNNDTAPSRVEDAKLCATCGKRLDEPPASGSVHKDSAPPPAGNARAPYRENAYIPAAPSAAGLSLVAAAVDWQDAVRAFRRIVGVRPRTVALAVAALVVAGCNGQPVAPPTNLIAPGFACAEAVVLDLTGKGSDDDIAKECSQFGAVLASDVAAIAQQQLDQQGPVQPGAAVSPLRIRLEKLAAQKK